LIHQTINTKFTKKKTSEDLAIEEKGGYKIQNKTKQNNNEANRVQQHSNSIK